jgi:virginiamycin B lyase
VVHPQSGQRRRQDHPGRRRYGLLPADGECGTVGIHADRESVWFAEIGAGQIGRILPDGRIAEFALPDPSCRPHAVVATADGGCWAASAAVRLDRHGCLVEQASFRPGAEPHGITLASDGSVWVALEAGALAHLMVDPPSA